MRDLPEGWVETTLGEVIELIIDHRGKTPKKLGGDWATSGYRAISAKTIKNGVLVNEEKMNILPENLYRKWMKVEVEYGDVFLTSEAPLGEHLIWKSDEKVVLSQRIYGIRTNKERLNPFYFNYFLDGDYFQHELKSRESGSTVTGIKQSELVQTKVILPPLPEQKAIADMLSSFDEKIELLREQNKTLETLAQTIFKEWFVNFNYPDATGEMVESELGLIPKGWRVGGIEDVFDFLEGPGIRNWQYTDSGTRFINIRLIQNGDILVHNSNFVSDEEGNGKYKHFHLQEKDFVLSTSGTLGRGAIVRKEHLPMILNTSVIRFRPKDKRSYGFLYQFLQSRYFLHELQSLASGSVQLNFGPMHLRKIRVIIPDVNALSAFAKVVNPLYEKITSNLSQVQTLSKTRDTLLPKLMSGQVRVQDEEVRRAML